MDQISRILRESLGQDAVLEGEAVSQRSNGYWDASPVAAKTLVRPSDTAQLSQTLSLCHQYGQSVITMGGLTGVVKGAKTVADDVVVSTERLSGIEQIDPVGATVTVRAGTTLQALQEAVEAQGFYFPLDLGARGSCTIGGNISTNAGGINVLRYGMMRDLVLGLEAVLADGTVISSMNTMLKNNAGYDLKQLFIGTEGTLGVVTRAVLKLFPKPVSRNTALVALPDFAAVCQLLHLLKSQLGGNLCAYEVMWGMYYRGMTVPGEHTPPLSRDHAFYVVLESEGGDVEQDEQVFLGALEQAMDQRLVSDAVIAKSDRERQSLWAIREEIEILLRKKPVFLYDVSLPIRDMADYVEEVRSSLTARWPSVDVDVFGHIADGNLHFFVKPNVEGDEHAQHLQSDQAIYDPLIRFGGSVSAEHGIGLDKKPWLRHTRSEAEVALMKTLKAALDPQNILNPGRVI